MRLFKKYTITLCLAVLFSLSVQQGYAQTFTIADGDVTALKAAFDTAFSTSESDVIDLATSGTYTFSNLDPSVTNVHAINGINLLGIYSFLSGTPITTTITLNAHGSIIQRDSGSLPLEFLGLAGLDGVIIK